VYQGTGSCLGVSYLNDAMTITGTGTTWDTSGTTVNCDLDTSGTKVDIGVSDVFAKSCGVDALPSDVKDFHGPIQAMTFVVPHDSTQTSISAEAAYLVFGLGKAGKVDPWTDETLLERRSDTSGTQQMISANIKVPASKWKGVMNAGSGDVLNALTSVGAKAENAIGIMATDLADKNRSTVTILAFQAFGQSCGYWPDSDSNSFDKANVRDGHYPMWGPLHMLTKTTSGKPTSDDAKSVIDYMQGNADAAAFAKLLTIESQGGVVPECAMRVSRTEDGGAMMSSMPDKSCECKFLKEATGSKPDSCTECSAASDCPKSKPACNYGFCEVK
jgi:ABC-type phosphate transport system substrate-binding protein